MENNSKYHCQEPRAKSQEPRAKSQDSVLKILVCYHKPYTIPPLDDGILLPIQVGKALTDIELNMQTDDEVNGQPCENISNKNKDYNELTAIYWAWKNLHKAYPEVKYVGISHYRRLFAFHDKECFSEFITRPESEIASYHITPSEAAKVVEILDSGKVILVKPKVRPVPAFIEYRMQFVSADYSILKNIFREKFPDYYDAFITVMEHRNKLSGRNMFIMRYDDFVKYCEWLFSVVFEFDARLLYSEFYHKRIFALMSEYLVNIWCKKNKKKLKFSEMYFYEEDEKVKPMNKLLVPFYFTARFARYLRRELIASLMSQNFTWRLRRLLTKKRE